VLNYEHAGAKEAIQKNRKWYQTPSDACQRHPSMPPADGPTQCDEYPLYGTEQGGTFATITPSLEVISAADNGAQGSMYGQFVQSWACNLQTGANPPDASRSERGRRQPIHRLARPLSAASADRLHLHIVNGSDTPAPIASTEQLDRLERALVDQRALVVDHFRPGLTDAQMDQLGASAGLVLPVEARRWYGWHDGAEGAHQALNRSIGGWRPLPLAVALAHGEQTRRILRRTLETAPPEHRWDLDWQWAAHWLPFAIPGHGAALGLECGVRVDEPSPVYYVEWANPVEGPPSPDAPSLGALIDRWLQAMESGSWRFDTATQSWLTTD
jgi:hypothetical protein